MKTTAFPPYFFFQNGWIRFLSYFCYIRISPDQVYTVACSKHTIVTYVIMIVLDFDPLELYFQLCIGL